MDLKEILKGVIICLLVLSYIYNSLFLNYIARKTECKNNIYILKANIYLCISIALSIFVWFI